MSKTEKQAAMRAEAKDLQARLGLLTLQVRNLRKEMAAISTILEYQEAQFSRLSQAPDGE